MVKFLDRGFEISITNSSPYDTSLAQVQNFTHSHVTTSPQRAEWQRQQKDPNILRRQRAAIVSHQKEKSINSIPLEQESVFNNIQKIDSKLFAPTFLRPFRLKL